MIFFFKLEADALLYKSKVSLCDLKSAGVSRLMLQRDSMLFTCHWTIATTQCVSPEFIMVTTSNYDRNITLYIFNSAWIDVTYMAIKNWMRYSADHIFSFHFCSEAWYVFCGYIHAAQAIIEKQTQFPASSSFPQSFLGDICFSHYIGKRFAESWSFDL